MCIFCASVRLYADFTVRPPLVQHVQNPYISASCHFSILFWPTVSVDSPAKSKSDLKLHYVISIMTTQVINSTHALLFAISLLHIAAFFSSSQACLPHKYYQCRQTSANRCVCLSMLSSGLVDVAGESVNKVLVSGGGKFAHQ